MVGAELFRQGPRPFAMSLVGLTNWVFTAVVALSFEMIQVSDGCLQNNLEIVTGLVRCLSFFLVWDSTHSLCMPALRPASHAGPMHNARDGTSVV